MASPTPWCAPADIEVRVAAAGVSGVDLAAMCQAATDVLFKLSGEQYDQRTDTIRPHRLNPLCDCDPQLLNWWYGWWNTLIRSCNCAAPDEIVLPGPVSELVEIRIDGVAVTGATLAAQYALYGGRRLVRLRTGQGFLGFPCCQRLASPLTEVGTWAVKFTHGKAPTEAASMAAKELAFQLALGFGNSAACKLPQRVRNITRQGVSVAILDAFDFLEKGKTGLYPVDLFLVAANPNHIRRRARVYSPDMPGLASS